MQSRTWEDFPEDRRGLFQRLRSPEGDRLVFEENLADAIFTHPLLAEGLNTLFAMFDA